MQARGTDWVALSNGRGQIARSPTVREVNHSNLYIHVTAAGRRYHTFVLACELSEPIARRAARTPRGVSG